MTTRAKHQAPEDFEEHQILGAARSDCAGIRA
jgi:hypothetical protein